jgi:2-haloacid dehalogenase
MTNKHEIQTVVFDLGDVLIGWDRRHLYRKIFKDDTQAMDYFLDNICTLEWNAEQDAGRPFQEAINALVAQHPEQRENIQAFKDRWVETLGDVDEDVVELLAQVKKSLMPVYALTNWSAETFPIARKKFEFLQWFDDILVSGVVNLKKPDLAIYKLLLNKFSINASTALFIDNSLDNVNAAKVAGMQAIHFKNATQLKQELLEFGVL